MSRVKCVTKMMTPIPMVDTYDDIEGLIYHMCSIFHGRYGGDYWELVSVANEVFMDAYRTWKPGKAPFTNFLCICIYRRLQRYKVWLDRFPDSLPFDVCRSKSLDLEEFCQQLSDEAETVVKLVFETPEELVTIANEKGGHAANLRTTIRDHLSDIGWSASQIAGSFQEIRNMLCKT